MLHELTRRMVDLNSLEMRPSSATLFFTYFYAEDETLEQRKIPAYHDF